MIHLMKGIILAGGTGSRLWPNTVAVSKQLLPVFNKPLVYYPLSTLMLAGVREVLLISTADALPGFQRLLGDGARLGISIEYRVQAEPRGIAEAVLIGADFIAGERFMLILGDNLFHGAGMGRSLAEELPIAGARVYLQQVQDPRAYGVAVMNGERIERIVEKPAQPLSPWAVTGLYALDGRAVEFARELEPSTRGELEIADLLNRYAANGELSATKLPRGTVWFDGGTASGLQQASIYVETVETRQGLLVGSPEEVSVRMGFTSPEQQLASLAEQTSDYAQALRALLRAPND